MVVSLDEAMKDVEDRIDDKRREARGEAEETVDESVERIKEFVDYVTENDVDFDGETVEDIADNINDISVTPPDWLSSTPTGGGGDDPFRPDPGSIDIDLSNVEELDTAGVLGIIARIEAAQMQTLFDIANAVEPFSSVTVSGSVTIEESETAEPVVPRSDQTKVATSTLLVRADPDNTEPVYLGDDEVSPTSGYILQRGESQPIQLNFRINQLYMASAEAGQTVHLLGMV